MRQRIAALLADFNTGKAGPGDWRAVAIVLESDDGQLAGGLWGATFYDWLNIELLFIPPTCRGQGLGSRIIGMAEDKARARGCRGVWLDTFEFQARQFYEGLGYRVFGQLEDHPVGMGRYFLSKDL